MDESKDRAPSPSEEQATKGRGEPATKGRKGSPSRRPRPTDEDPGDEMEQPNPNREEVKAHIRSALSELRGGSRPGMTRAQRSLEAALKLI